MKIPLIEYKQEKPPRNKTVMFIWWFRGGFDRSQKTLGYLDDDDELVLDVNYGGNDDPTFWAYLDKSFFSRRWNVRRNKKRVLWNIPTK